MSGILTTPTLMQTGQYQCMNLEWGTDIQLTIMVQMMVARAATITSMGKPTNKINKKFKSRTSHNLGETGDMAIICHS